MILKNIKTGKAYEFASYLASEAESVFFSLARPMSDISSRLGGISSDADTEVYKRLTIIAVIASIGVVGATVHYLIHRKYMRPQDIAGDALETTADFAGDAINSAGNAVNVTGKVVNSASQTIRDGARGLSEKFK